MAKSVRMADVAAKVGVSIVSVSKALAGKEGVGDEMRAKILAAAEELGYQSPSAKAALTQGNGGQIIGVLVADRFFDGNAFYSNLYRALLRCSAPQGISVAMEIVSPQAEFGCIMPTFLVNRKVDGLIFMGEIDRRYMATAAQSGLPFLQLDFYDDTITADCVLSDNVSGAYQLTETILRTGRSKIAFLGSVNATSCIMDRYLGYTKALLCAGIEPRADWRLEDRGEDGRFTPIRLPEEMPEAFVCSCDEVAYNLVETLRRKGVRVPEDVAVAGYDDFRYSTICDPPLTSYRVDVEGMAAAAVDQMRRKMAHKTSIATTVMVPGALVVRESTK